MPFVTSTDGVRIFYTTTGQGETFVLSHGSTHSWESWQDLGYVDGLKDRCRLILIDSRGHGQSGKPHDPAAYTMPQQVDDVVAVVTDLGVDRFHFWGYSQGVQIGFHLGARVPARVQTFVAYGGHPYPSSPEDRAFIEDIKATLRQGMQAWVQRMEISGVFTQYPNPAARKERLLAADVDALIAVNTASGKDPGATDSLSRLTMPCLLIVGDQDSGNDLARQAAKDLPVADFVSVSGIGHSMVHAQTILPYVRAFLDRFRMVAGDTNPSHEEPLDGAAH